MATCFDLLRSFSGDDPAVLAACIGQQASIRAAKIGARATTNAAVIQIAAAIIAAFAAIMAALRQARQAERNHERRASAYRKTLADMVPRMIGQLRVYKRQIEESPEADVKRLASISLYSFEDFGSFTANRLENAELLGPNSAAAIYEVSRRLGEVRGYKELLQLEASGKKRDKPSWIRYENGQEITEPPAAILKRACNAAIDALETLRRQLHGRSED